MFSKNTVQGDARCDVAVVGAGPVGAHIAGMVKAAAPELSVKVFDKRPVATRDHSLRIGTDSIDAVRRFYAKYSGQIGSNQAGLAALDATAAQWRGRSVRTSKIETVMAGHGAQLGVSTHRAKSCAVSASNLDFFLNLTQARVVIAADGAKSHMRTAIGAQRCEEQTLSHLLEFKFSVSPELDPRTHLVGSSQAVRAEGWDFETAGRADPERQERRFALHKFINRDTHDSILASQGGVARGTAENAWTLRDFSEHAQHTPGALWVDKHISNYLYDYELQPREFWDDRVLTFPMTIYRSTRSAKNIDGQVVALAGDANAGLVLERGANKGLIEASLCADATVAYMRALAPDQPTKSARMRYLHAPSREFSALDLAGVPQTRPRPVLHACVDAPARGDALPLPLPAEFFRYEASTQKLFAKERHKAVRKAVLLSASETVLKFFARPVNWLLDLSFRGS